jgi:acetyl esterase
MTGMRHQLDPQIGSFAESSDRLFTAAYDALPPTEQRRIYDGWCAEWSAPRPAEIVATDFLVPTAEAEVPVRLYRPRARTGKLPVILYMHGGGWILGNRDSHDQVTAQMALQTDAAVLSIDYRLAPEHKFPAAFNDCYGVLTWLAANGAALDLDLDVDRLAVAGDSAGGNLAVAVALAARDRRGPRIVFQGLIYPSLRFQQAAAIASDNPQSNSPGLTMESLGIYAQAYLGHPADAQNPYAAPLMAETFADLPPAYIAAAWFDVIRADSEVYAEKLQASGVAATYRCAPGLPHTYLRTLHFCTAAQAEFAALCGALKKALVEKAGD